MKKSLHILLLALLLATCTACEKQEEFSNTPEGNFDALWTILDQHYSFFEYKNIDWNNVGRAYRAKVRPEMTNQELFDLCSSMLMELRDGHTNLISAGNVSRYWIWEKRPLNYNERLIDEHYLHFDYRRASGLKYQILDNNYGYLHYGDFGTVIGEGNLDAALEYLASSDGLVIDVRSNGGGYLTNVERLVGRFISNKIYAGAVSHKKGPGHDDFSKPYDYYFSPTKSRIHYLKPVVVLANRGSFSATNNFVSIMKSLPNVKIVGDTTGGGSGLPFTSELPNGWTIRFSACPITGPDGQPTELGVAPNVQVDLDPADEASGTDTMLERAFSVLGQTARSTATSSPASAKRASAAKK